MAPTTIFVDIMLIYIGSITLLVVHVKCACMTT